MSFKEQIEVPKIMGCSIPLPKIPMRKLCKDNNIKYRFVVSDYNLDVSEDDNSSESESGAIPYKTNSMTASEYEDDPMFEPPPSQTKSRKKKKYLHRYSPKKNKRRLSPESMANKRLKTSDKCNNRSVVLKSTPKSTPKRPSTASSVSSKTVIKPTEINGKTHLRAVQMNFSHIHNTHNNQSLSKSNQKNPKPKTKPERQPLRTKQEMPSQSKIIEFLGDHFRQMDLFDNHCECENDCELDELSMAFHFLTTLPSDQLPNDLKIAVNGRTADQLSSEEDKSDPNIDEFPAFEDVCQLTIEEEKDNCAFQYIDDFVVKTTLLHPLNQN